MKKQKQKTPEPKPVAKKQPTKPAVPDYLFVAITTAAYALVVAIGIFHHEPWRDEIHAWIIARDSKSIADLFYNLRFEGHPGLWHLLLYVLNMFTHNPFSMQLLDGAIAVLTMFLFLWFAPFSRLQKILFASGYFMLFEYAMLARNYTLGILFIVLFMVLYKNKEKNAVWLGLSLFLLASTNLEALIVDIALLLVWMVDTLKKKNSLQFYTGIFLAIVGIILAAWQIKPDPHTRNYIMWADGFDMSRLRFAFADMVRAFIPLPDFSFAFWNTTLLIKDPVNISGGVFFISLLMWLIFSFLFLRNKNAFILFVTASIGIISLTYLIFLPYLRYIGHLYIAFIAAYWFGEIKSGDKNYQRLIPSALLSISNSIYKGRYAILFALLMLQTISGAFAWYSDVNYVFSQNKNVAEYLTKEKMTNLEIIGASDMMTEGIDGWLNKPLYYTERKEYGTFIKWDDKRQHDLPLQPVLKEAINQTAIKNEPVLFVSSKQINDAGMPLSRKRLNDSIEIVFVQQFAPSIVPEESFYIYRLQKVK